MFAASPAFGLKTTQWCVHFVIVSLICLSPLEYGVGERCNTSLVFSARMELQAWSGLLCSDRTYGALQRSVKLSQVRRLEINGVDTPDQKDTSGSTHAHSLSPSSGVEHVSGEQL